MLVVPHLINTRFRGLVPGPKNLIIHSRSTSLEEIDLRAWCGEEP